MMILLMCTTSFALSFQPVSVILDSALVPFISLFIDIEHALCSLATFFFFFPPPAQAGCGVGATR